jgi:hypothetical protein
MDLDPGWVVSKTGQGKKKQSQNDGKIKIKYDRTPKSRLLT